MSEKIREKLKVTKEQANELIWGDLEGFSLVEDTITDTSRWSVYHRLVIKRESDSKLFADNYGIGATEYQDERPWQDDEPAFEEVFPVEKTIIIYE